jgi:tetratricopeptide (TPR) repeat protein
MRKLALLLLLAACRAPEEKPPPAPAPPPAPSAELDEATWRAEAEQILFERHLRLAQQYRDALDLDPALDHVDRALALQPGSEKARALRTELQRMMGDRAGEARTILDDSWLAMQAREEQRVVEAQRMLKEARAAEEAGDFERAATLYKRALYLAREP